MTTFDPIVRDAVVATLEPGEQLRAWAWGPADLRPEPGAILGQILLTLLGVMWRALLSPLLRLLALVGGEEWQQVLGKQCWMAVTDRRVLAQPFTFQRRLGASVGGDGVRLSPGAAVSAWPVGAAPRASVTVVRSARIIGFPDHPGLLLGYAPEAGDERARQAVALQSELLGPEG